MSKMNTGYVLQVTGVTPRRFIRHGVVEHDGYKTLVSTTRDMLEADFYRTKEGASKAETGGWAVTVRCAIRTVTMRIVP